MHRHWPLTALAAALGLLLVWGMLAPLSRASHELLLAFPRSADAGLALPADIRLTRGVQDVLLLRNDGLVPVVFGPLTVGAGRAVRLPFGEDGVHVFACPLVAGKVVRVRVVAAPDPGWGRLKWRFRNLGQTLRYLPLRAPGA